MPFPPDAQIELWPWHTTFTASNGNRIHNLTRATTGAGVDATDVDDPASSATRRVQRCRAPANGTQSYIVFNLKELQPGETSLTESFDDITMEAEIYLDWQGASASPTRVMTFAAIIHNNGLSNIATVSAANGGRCRVDTGATNSSSAGVVFPEKEWKLIRVRYRASTGANDGVVQVWVSDTDGSNRTLAHEHTHNDTTAAGRIGYGAQNTGFGTSNIDAYIATIACHRQTTIDRFNLSDDVFCIKDGGFPLYCSGVTQTSASVSVQWHPSVHDHSWTTADDVQFDIEYVAGDYDEGTFPGSGTSTTSAVNIPSSDEFCGCTAITGLTAGTTYSYRCRAFRSGTPGTRYVGPVCKFRTMPSAASKLEFTTHFCQKMEEHFPISHGQIAGFQLDFRWHGGDWYYCDIGGAVNQPTAFAPPQTTQEYLRDFPRVVLMSRFVIIANRQSAIFISDDDHDAGENNWDQGYVKGFVTATNTTGADGLDRALNCQDTTLAGASITRGQYYDRMQEGIHKVQRAAQVGTVVAGTSWHDRSEHRLIETGHTAICILDTRRFQDRTGDQPFSGGSATMLGADQLAYWKDYLQNTCTKPNVFIFSPANLSDLHVASDCWQSDANTRAEWLEIEDAMMANDAIKRVYLFSADRHATCIDRRKGVGQYGRTTAFPKMMVHSRIGSMGAGAVPAYYSETETANVLFTTDFDAGGAGRSCRGYGRFTFNESTGEILIRVYDDDGDLRRAGLLGGSEGQAEEPSFVTMRQIQGIK